MRWFHNTLGRIFCQQILNNFLNQEFYTYIWRRNNIEIAYALMRIVNRTTTISHNMKTNFAYLDISRDIYSIKTYLRDIQVKNILSPFIWGYFHSYFSIQLRYPLYLNCVKKFQSKCSGFDRSHCLFVEKMSRILNFESGRILHPPNPNVIIGILIVLYLNVVVRSDMK